MRASRNRYLAIPMQKLHYRDLILRAVRERDWSRLDMIAAQLDDAERAREILRAKGYGEPGMSASSTVAQVPEVRACRD